MTLFFIFFYPTFICGFTATSVPTFIWHFFITSHAGTCSAEGLFIPTFTWNLFSPSLLSHFNMTLPHGSPRIISIHLNMVSFSLFLSHLYMALILLITPWQFTFRSFSKAFPRRVFHDPFRFQPVFYTSFPDFSSDNHVLTRFS